MKRNLLFTLFFFGTFSGFAQTVPFYYYGNQKIPLKNSSQKIFLRLPVGETGKAQNFLKTGYQLQDKDIKPLATENIMVIDLGKEDAVMLQQAITGIKALGGVESVKPAIIAPDGKTVVIDDGFYVKLKQGVSVLQLQNLVAEKNCILQKRYGYDDRTFILKAGAANDYDGMAMANLFYQTGLFEYAEPDFQVVDKMNGESPKKNSTRNLNGKGKQNTQFKTFSTPNDPLYNYQWWAKNDGSPLQYNGVVGADIDLDEAWDITQGSSSIRVAVIDEGVDRAHPDLINNIDPLGFGIMASVATTGDIVSSSLSHGTSCAGIVAAQANNSIGVAGVAPMCKIIPVSVVVNTSGNYGSSAQLAQCIDWAWDNGSADVLSNSWGGGLASSLIHDAIIRAVTLGRAGKGAVVVFCTQNYDAGITSPSCFKETIAVGAMSMCEQRKAPASCDGEYWWGANYGLGLDISAPGVKIATTANVGTEALPDEDYNLTFNGTSSATPMVSGVAALILSLNSNFTQQQVRQIIEQSARKVPGFSYSNVEGQPYNTWNAEIGYGMLNAKNALLLAQSPVLCNVDVNLPNTLQACSGGSISLQVTNANAGDSYQWRKDDAVVASGTSYAATQSGNYDVVLTTAGGCKDTSYKLSVNISLPDGPLAAHAGADTSIVPNAKIFLGGGPAASGGTGILHPMRGMLMDISYNRFLRFDPNQPGERSKIIKNNFISNPQTNQFYCGAAVTPYGLYMMDRYSYQLVKVDTATGTTYTIGAATNTQQLNGMCYDPVTGKIFAVGKVTSGNNGLFEVNRKTGEITFIAEITNASLGTKTLISLSANNSGQLFAVNLSTTDNVSALLFSINKTTGSAMMEGALGFLMNYAQDGAFDLLNNQLYQAANTGPLPYNNGIVGRGLWKINGPLISSTLVGSIGEPTFTSDALCFTNKEYKYQWSPATFLSNPNDANPQFSTATPGTYPYTLTVTDLCGNTNTDQVVVTVSVTAPVTLLSFNGVMQNKSSLLKWIVQNEINFDKYEVERSVDGLRFTKIGEKKALGSTVSSSYKFTDNNLPQEEMVYYRLKMLDMDGQFTYSDVIKLSKEKVNKNRLMAIGPNPFNKNLSIQYESAVNEMMQLVFYNSKGQELLRQNHGINKGINQIYLTLPQWSSGLYFIRLKTATENIVQKVLKL